MKYGWDPWSVQAWAAEADEASDPSLPFVSIGVLTCNRCEDLRRTLDVLTHAVQYPSYEIILIDNGSSDGTLAMVHSEYPNVIVHEVGENVGVSSRNFQARLARGKYLFSYDDDSIPATPATLLHIIRHMEAYPEIAALGTTYYRPFSGWMETAGWEIFRLSETEKVRGIGGQVFAEGAACFRLDALRRVNGYDKAIFWGTEATDLVLQLYQQNHLTFLCPWFGTLHFASPVMRLTGERPYINARNLLWIMAKHWPLPLAVALIMGHFLRRALAIGRHPRAVGSIVRGLFDGLRGVKLFLGYRPKLRARQVWNLGRFYYGMYRWN